MAQSSVDSRATIPDVGSPTHAVWLRQRLRDISMFFDGTDPVHKAMRKLADLFEQHQIAYVIVGGMAVNAHKHLRTTGDIDFLIRAEGLSVIRQLAAQGLLAPVSGRSRRFTEPTTGIPVDVLVTGSFPGSGRPGPIAFPDPAAVDYVANDLHFINLRALVELKLAAHRYQDFADVVNLIRANDLDESFMAQLHKSVHNDFIECLEEKRREDDYEKREG